MSRCCMVVVSLMALVVCGACRPKTAVLPSPPVGPPPAQVTASRPSEPVVTVEPLRPRAKPPKPKPEEPPQQSAPEPTPAKPEPPGKTPRLVLDGPFTCGAIGNWIAFVRLGDIWVMKPDGSGQQRLTRGAYCEHPSWSSDGKSLAFVAVRNAPWGAGDIWRLDLLPLRLTRLTTSGDCRRAAWRPNQQEVWCLRPVPHAPEPRAALWRIDADDGSARPVVRLAEWVWPEGGHLSWRSDGEVVALTAAVGDAVGVDLYRADGTAVTLGAWPARGDLETVEDLAWSPAALDEVAVAFPRRADADRPCPEGVDWLATASTDTMRARRLFRAGLRLVGTSGNECYLSDGVSWPCWSPDGRSVAFAVSRWAASRCEESIWTVGSDGRSAREVAGDASQPAWTPVTVDG